MVELLIQLITAFIMMIVGLDLTCEQLAKCIKQPLSIGIALAAQFITLPLIALSLVIWLAPPKEIALGLILLAACPGGAISNYYVFLARGDLAYSVMITIFTSILAFITLPLLFNSTVAVLVNSEYQVYLPFVETCVQLFKLLLLPLIIGIFFRFYFSEFSLKALPLLRWVSLACVLLIIGLIFYLNHQDLFHYLQIIIEVALLYTLVTVFAGFMIGKLFKMDAGRCLAIAVELPARNLAIATSVSLSILLYDKAALFAASFIIIQAPFLLLLALAYQRYIQPSNCHQR